MTYESKAILGVILGIVFFIGFCLWGLPQYRVYSSSLYGEAELKQAELNRQIKVRESQAKLESAKFEAQAEVERAKGAAESNRILGASLKDNEAYLRYLYINALMDKDNNIIYVPTEAGLPILEAGHRK